MRPQVQEEEVLWNPQMRAHLLRVQVEPRRPIAPLVLKSMREAVELRAAQVRIVLPHRLL